MSKKFDLTKGPIFSTLTKLALPIMGSAFIQMAYNLFDMYCVGNLGYKSVAAVGTASFYIMLSFSIVILTRIGAEVHVAQSLGRKDIESAKTYSTTALQLALITALIYAVLGFIFQNQLIGFFKLNDPSVIELAKQYLTIIILSIPFLFLNNIMTGLFNAGGLSHLPFYGALFGLIVKIIANIFFVLGFGNFFNLGVKGAALGTVVAQIATFLILLVLLIINKTEYLQVNVFRPLNTLYAKNIMKLGFPAAIQNFIFTLISMVIGRIVAVAGVEAVSVQRIGAQIESVSWMTASGFSTALSAFVGQNFGAKKYDRLVEGFIVGTKIVAGIGLFATLLLMLLPRQLFTIFIDKPEYVVNMGVSYLIILGISQFFQSLEISTNGAFNGVGKTHIPSIIGIILQGARIPAALILMKTALGINGVWWAISMSTVLKGIIGLIVFYILVIKKIKNGENIENKKVYKN